MKISSIATFELLVEVLRGSSKAIFIEFSMMVKRINP